MKKVLIDLTGKRFGRWLVLSRAPNRRGHAYWNCQCDCGTEKVVWGNSLRRGESLSCGCLKRDMARERNISHGQTGCPTYNSWQNMKIRCYNKNRPKNVNYHDKEIIVCDRWLNSFPNFLADMGERPEGTSIERINNDGNYEPTNCKWATRKEQGRNRYNNRMITYQGEKKCLAEWAEELGIDYNTLHSKLRYHSLAALIPLYAL